MIWGMHFATEFEVHFRRIESLLPCVRSGFCGHHSSPGLSVDSTVQCSPDSCLVDHTTATPFAPKTSRGFPMCLRYQQFTEGCNHCVPLVSLGPQYSPESRATLILRNLVFQSLMAQILPSPLPVFAERLRYRLNYGVYPPAPVSAHLSVRRLLACRVYYLNIQNVTRTPRYRPIPSGSLSH